jgi:hypothetical protein
MAGRVKAKFRTKTRKETLNRIFFYLRGKAKVGRAGPVLTLRVKILLSFEAAVRAKMFALRILPLMGWGGP